MTETTLFRDKCLVSQSLCSFQVCPPQSEAGFRLSDRHLLPLLGAPGLALKEVGWLQDYRLQLCADVFTQVKRQGTSGATLRSWVSAAWSHNGRETRGGSGLF